MKKICTLIIIVVFGCIILNANFEDLEYINYSNELQDSNLSISELKVNSNRIGLYEKFEISFSLNGNWDNPFDPDQIKVDGYFYSPDGKTFIVPGFYYQDYKITVTSEEDIYEKVGDPLWKIRFAPSMEGEYKFQILAKSKSEEFKTPLHKFSSIKYNKNHGFLRISKVNPLYFEFDDGTSFTGIAMDKASGRVSGFEAMYKRFAASGGNYNRLFLTGGVFNIEEQISRDPKDKGGLGIINLDASWRLDKVIEIGEFLGIYHQLCLTNQTNFRTNSAWKINSYNKANGGILDSPEEYLSSEKAIKFFQRRLRYIVARWGYSTSVFSWNLWNEVSATQGFKLSDAIQWHKRMAKYISSIDPFKHIIHTNDGRLNSYDELSSLPEMEIISTNIYAVKDIANISEIWTKKMINQFKKPYILTEYGMGHNLGDVGGYSAMDPERIMVHNGMWSPLMSGSASTGMAWDWDWLDFEGFYSYIKAISDFTDAIPFSKYFWDPVTVSSFKYKNKTESYYADIIVEGWPGNFGIPNKAVTQELFSIDRNGRVEPQDLLHAVLGDTTGQRSYWSDPTVTFKVNYQKEGQFVVYVSELRATNPTPQLSVLLDGKQVLKRDLLPLNISNYHPRIYNQFYTLNIPGGSHEITIQNSGGGKFVTAFELKNYILRNGPDLEVRGLKCKDYILLWLKNQKFTVLHEMTGQKADQESEGILELDNVPTGLWIVEWFNTINADLIRSEIIKSVNNKIILNTPTVDKSIAIRLKKV